MDGLRQRASNSNTARRQIQLEPEYDPNPLPKAYRRLQLEPMESIPKNSRWPRIRQPLQPLQPRSPTTATRPLPPTTHPVPPRRVDKPHLVADKDVPNILWDRKHGKQYAKGTYLGEGGFARVYQVQGDNNQWYAAKVITKAALRQSKNKEKLLAEINIHRSMSHNSIIRFVSCFEDQTNVYLIVELCHNKTLAELMKTRGRLTEPEVRYILIQILDACRYMHENRVIHRDIKLGNILLDKNLDVKVGDFGLSALLLSSEDRKRTICGTPNYIAPEILFGKEGHDYKVDIWSIGVLTYTLLVGRHPFHQSELRDIYKKIRNNSHEASYGFPSEHPVSDVAKDLIAHLLVNDPKERLSVPEVLQHPFFRGGLPRRIPGVALVREPTMQELFSRGSLDDPNPPGKAADVLQSTVNGTTDYCKRQSLAPLELLSEQVPDFRVQFPSRVENDPWKYPLNPTNKRSSVFAAQGSRQRRRVETTLQPDPLSKPNVYSKPSTAEPPIEPVYSKTNSNRVATSPHEERGRQINIQRSGNPTGRIDKENEPPKESGNPRTSSQGHQKLVPLTIPPFVPKPLTEQRSRLQDAVQRPLRSNPRPISDPAAQLGRAHLHLPRTHRSIVGNPRRNVDPVVSETHQTDDSDQSPSTDSNRLARNPLPPNILKPLPLFIARNEGGQSKQRKLEVDTPEPASIESSSGLSSRPIPMFGGHLNRQTARKQTQDMYKPSLGSKHQANEPERPRRPHANPKDLPLENSVSEPASQASPLHHIPTVKTLSHEPFTRKPKDTALSNFTPFKSRLTRKPFRSGHTATNTAIDVGTTMSTPPTLALTNQTNQTTKAKEQEPPSNQQSKDMAAKPAVSKSKKPRDNSIYSFQPRDSLGKKQETDYHQKGLGSERPVENPNERLQTPTATISFLKTLDRALRNALYNRSKHPVHNPSPAPETPFEWGYSTIFVSKWVDYTCRYGIGYGLTDGTKGVLFNDNSICITHNESTFTFSNNDRYAVPETYNKDVVPDIYLKKFTLMYKFIKYMSENLGESSPANPPMSTTANGVYVSKFMVSGNLMVFKLTNDVLQFNFYDGVKLVLTEYATKIILIDRTKVLRRFSLAYIETFGEPDIVNYLWDALRVIQENLNHRPE